MAYRTLVCGTLFLSFIAPALAEQHSSSELHTFDDAAIQQMVRHGDDDFYSELPSGTRDPANLLAAQLSAGQTVEDAVRVLAEEFDLDTNRARDLAFGLFVTVPGYRVTERSEGLRAEAETALYRVVEAQPNLVAVWARIGRLVEVGRKGCDDGRYLDALFEQGVDMALQVYELEFCLSILQRALALEPGSLHLLEKLHNATSYGAPMNIALAELWYAKAADAGAEDEVRFAAFAALLQRLAEAGLTQELVNVVRTAETADRIRMANVVDSRAETALSHYVYALLLNGHHRAAMEYLGAVRELANCEQHLGDCASLIVLKTVLENGDAFDVAATSLSSINVGELLFLELVEEYAAAQGYEEIANHHRELIALRSSYFLSDKYETAELLAQLGEDFKSRVAHYRERIASIYPPPPPDAERAVDRPREMMKAPHFFNEEPLAKMGRATACDPVPRERHEMLAESSGLWPVRVEECEQSVVMLGMSQSLDPVGETSPGGYWLAISEDGGRDWRNIYTGLRVHAPYVAKPESELPLLSDGRVTLHVDVRELDPSSVTFPPVAMRMSRSVDDVVVTADLDTLVKDTDADGLSDLVEDRMQLDPNNPDSDGDGQPDGFDLLPNVPHGELTDRGEALSLALEEMLGYERSALIEDANPGGGRPWERGVGVPPSRTLFFVTDEPELFQGQMAPFRMVVLRPTQEQEIEEKTGVFYPLRLTNFWFSKDGNHALLQWSARWHGGVIYLEKGPNGWKKEVLSRWIT